MIVTLSRVSRVSYGNYTENISCSFSRSISLWNIGAIDVRAYPSRKSRSDPQCIFLSRHIAYGKIARRVFSQRENQRSSFRWDRTNVRARLVFSWITTRDYPYHMLFRLSRTRSSFSPSNATRTEFATAVTPAAVSRLSTSRSWQRRLAIHKESILAIAPKRRSLSLSLVITELREFPRIIIREFIYAFLYFRYSSTCNAKVREISAHLIFYFKQKIYKMEI